MALKAKMVKHWFKQIRHSRKVLHDANKMVSRYASIFHSTDLIVPADDLEIQRSRTQNDEPLDFLLFRELSKIVIQKNNSRI